MYLYKDSWVLALDPHLYQASAGDVTTMSKADVVVYNGIHLEGKMGSIFDNLTKQNKSYHPRI